MTVQIDMAVRHRVGIQKLSGVVLVDSQQGGGRGKRTSHIFPQAKLKWEQRHPQAPEQNRCQPLLRTWNTSRHFLTIESSGSVAKCRGSWVVGRGRGSWVVGRGSWVVGRGSWVWVWVNVVGKNKPPKKIKN